MTTIYRYQPARTPGPNGNDPRPLGPDGDGYADTLTELCELDGWRYVSVPDAVVPHVPADLVTWQLAPLDDALREAIKAASPQVRLARERCVQAIRASYSIDDELYLARIATGAQMGTYTLQAGEAGRLAGYQAHVEACRADLHLTYAELGL